jgi:predicted transcriptional regulator of viral defense system
VYTEHNPLQEPSKELGNTEARLLAALASRDRAIFTTEDARQAGGASASATNSLISGLLKKKWLIRLNRGVYLIVPLSAGEASEHSENWYIVAKHLIQPAPYYLSHFSALEIHEMTTQPVLTVYISTPIRRISKEIAGATYRFVTTSANDLWGAEDIWVTQSERVTVSDLERTILDCLDRPDLAGGIIEVTRGMWAVRSQLDFSKLADYAKRLGRKSVAKRLGFLLETFGLGDTDTLAALRPLVSPSYTLLDPSLPADGRHVRSWRVRANLEPEELLSATTT